MTSGLCRRGKFAEQHAGRAGVLNDQHRAPAGSPALRSRGSARLSAGSISAPRGRRPARRTSPRPRAPCPCGADRRITTPGPPSRPGSGRGTVPRTACPGARTPSAGWTIPPPEMFRQAYCSSVMMPPGCDIFTRMGARVRTATAGSGRLRSAAGSLLFCSIDCGARRSPAAACAALQSNGFLRRLDLGLVGGGGRYSVSRAAVRLAVPPVGGWPW